MSVRLLAVSLAVFAVASSSAAAQAQPNRPPWLRVEKRINVGVGEELDFSSFEASDPDGDLLTFAAEGLPAGTRYETRTGDLIWTPTESDVGEHVVTFSASDGQFTAFALTRILVSPPEPLRLSLPDEETLVVNQPWSTDVASPFSGLEVSASDLPTGATFDAKNLRLSWTPPGDAVGDHAVRILASKAGERAEHVVVLHVRPAVEEWLSYALPGLGYTAYVPLGSPDIGLLQGPSFEVVVAQWVHRNDNVGPSHGRFSLRADLLFPLSNPAEPAVIYSASMALSLERNPERSFLVPIFAVDIGGLYQKQLGNALQVTPSIGVHIFQSRNIFITAELGYLLALPNLEDLHGPRASIGGNFTLW